MELLESKPEDLEKIIELRQKVLHPEGPKSRVVYEKDKDSSTKHFILKDEKGVLLVTGTLMLEAEDGSDTPEYRIRGMAVEESFRGQGFGSKLIDKFLEICEEEKIKKVWCNARVRALSLYEKKGFVKTGDPFDVPGSGPHYRMQLFL